MIYVVGGGTSLNFNVVGGTSAPTSPKENTIWVNTSTTITSWVFSATQPTGSSGMVWFQTEEKSTAPFNALKKNNITVCPVSAKQYVSGKWTDKTAKVRQNGAWVEAKLAGLYIFKSGEGEKITMKHLNGRNATVSVTANSIVHTNDGGSDAGSVSTTQSAVSLAGYTTLKARVKCAKVWTTNDNAPCIGFCSTLASSYTMSPDIARANFEANSAETVYSLRVPSGTTSAYIMVAGFGQETIYDIWLE